MIFHNYICSHVQKASKTVVDYFLPWANFAFGLIYKSLISDISLQNKTFGTHYFLDSLPLFDSAVIWQKKL